MSGSINSSKRVLLAIIMIASLVTMAFGSPASSLQQTEDRKAIIKKYQRLIPLLMAEQDLPGLAVVVVDDRGILWAEGFGYTDRDHRIPVTPDTLFSVQSISKTFTATAVLRAVQDGLLNLDEPITTYLPDFTAHSLFDEHPERKITLRMLLSHTAGFTFQAPLGNTTDLGHVDFEDHIKSISDTWLRFPVGTGYAYSNLGISLAGYILQKVSGQPFPLYMQEHVLDPLGMEDSSFDMQEIGLMEDRAIGHRKPYPRVPLEIPIVPEGGLYTSANEMARFLRFQLNRGSLDGKSLLSPALLDEMYTVPAPNQGSRDGYGLGVERHAWNKNRSATLMSHGGEGYGFLSKIWWLPELKIGIAMLTNSQDHQLLDNLDLQILDDFIHDPNRVYLSRLEALPDRPPVAMKDRTWLPPPGLAQAIARHGMQPSDQDLRRWAAYTGSYGMTGWGLLVPWYAQVYESGRQLHIRLPLENIDLPLTEVSPGLFFTEYGEVLDLRGPVPRYQNLKLVKVGEGPAPWQKAVLILCGLVFLSGLLYFPVRRIRRAASPAGPSVRWTKLTPVLVILTSLSGLLSLALIVAVPTIIYVGFLGWLELPVWQRLVMHAPFALLVSGLAFMILVVIALIKHWWSYQERAYYLVISFTSLLLLLFLAQWHMIGLGI